MVLKILNISFFLFFSIMAIGQYSSQNLPLEQAKKAIKNQSFLEAYTYASQAKPILSPTTDLFESYQNTTDYLAIIEQITALIINPSGKQIFYQLEFDAYEQMIEICEILHRTTKRETYFQQAYELNEKHRNLLMFNTLGFGINTFSDSLKNVEGNYLSRVSALEDRLKWEKKQPITNQKRIDELEQERDNWQEKYSNFLKKNNKNNISTALADCVDLTTLQQNVLHQNEVFVSYFFGKKSIFVFVIHSDKKYFFKLKTKKKPSEISALIEEVLVNLHSPNEAKAVRELHELYLLVFQAIENRLNGKKILQIVADNALSKLPFDALLSDMPKNWDYNYQKLPYLIRQYEINYQHSATIFAHQRQIAQPLKNPKILLLAPDFKGVMMNGKPLNELKKSTFLIQALQKKWDGVFLEKEKASFQNFKKYTTDCQIIHLATHTFVDNEMPLNTQIKFSKKSKPLIVSDLYKMNLSSNLAILGSCQTGAGTYQVGIGRVGLSYGFHLAGVPSLVYSLWEVDETATNDLLLLFYDGLHQGLNKGTALHQAKIKYLKQSNEITADPYYWAGFVLQGDTQNFEKSKYDWRWILGISTLTLFALILLKYRRMYSIDN